MAKGKDGSTHIARKAEYAVDLETAALVAVTLQGADRSDTTMRRETVAEAVERIAETAGATPPQDGTRASSCPCAKG